MSTLSEIINENIVSNNSGRITGGKLNDVLQAIAAKATEVEDKLNETLNIDCDVSEVFQEIFYNTNSTDYLANGAYGILQLADIEKMFGVDSQGLISLLDDIRAGKKNEMYVQCNLMMGTLVANMKSRLSYIYDDVNYETIFFTSAHSDIFDFYYSSMATDGLKLTKFEHILLFIYDEELKTITGGIVYSAPESLIYNGGGANSINGIQELVVEIGGESIPTETQEFNETDVAEMFGMDMQQLNSTLRDIALNDKPYRMNVKFSTSQFVQDGNNLINCDPASTSIMIPKDSQYGFLLTTKFSIPGIDMVHLAFGGIKRFVGYVYVLIVLCTEDGEVTGTLMVLTPPKSFIFEEATGPSYLSGLVKGAFDGCTPIEPRVYVDRVVRNSDIYIYDAMWTGEAAYSGMEQCIVMGNFAVNDEHPSQKFYSCGDYGSLDGSEGRLIAEITEPGNYQFVYQNCRLTINKVYV